MKVFAPCFLVVVCLVCCGSAFAQKNDKNVIQPPFQVEREWKTADGKFSVMARLVGEIDNAVVLKRENGKLIEVSRSRLSENDLTFITQTRKSSDDSFSEQVDSQAKPLHLVVSEKEVGNRQRSVTVRLIDENPTLDQMKRLAVAIRQDETKQYDQTLIFYYLPGWEINGDAWAIARLDPEVKVDFLRESQQKKEDAVVEDMLPRDRRKTPVTETEDAPIILGTWNGMWIGMPGTISLVRTGEAYSSKMKFNDGSDLVQPLNKKVYKTETRYHLKDEPDTYYQVNRKGDLEIKDDEGVIAEFFKVPGQKFKD